MYLLTYCRKSPASWNKGGIIGQKALLTLRDIWATRIRLQMGNRPRDLALFNLAIDRRLRARDLVKRRLSYIAHGSQVARRAIVLQQKTQEADTVRTDRPGAGISFRTGTMCRAAFIVWATCSKAYFSARPVSRTGNMPASWIHGLRPVGSIQLPAEHISIRSVYFHEAV